VSWAPSRQTRLQLNRRIFSGFSRRPPAFV
jgi:hypothetical protein